MLKSSVFIFLFTLSVANAQFLYNYEEDSPDEPETQSYDQSAYQYNSPSAANQQFAQPRQNDAESSTETGKRRTRIRVRSRNYDSDQNNSQQPQIVPEQEVDHRDARQQRRQARRQQRQSLIEPITPPRVYSPSVFENIGLGEAPSGIYIPQDSFLNVLRNPSRRAEFPSPVSQAVATVPQTTNYVQPYINNGPTFFVQPPSNEHRGQSNLIERPQIEYANSPVSQSQNANRPRLTQNVQARAVGRNRRVRIQPEYAAPPTVDIDSLRESTDDVGRENVMSSVEYAPVQSFRAVSRSPNRRRMLTNYQESTPAPRIYSPSVFEKVALGEAPSGIYVPEDSLLNVLRNPGPPTVSRAYHQEVQQLPPPQPIYSEPEEYAPEIIEEDQYQPPPTRRRSSPRSRQTRPSRRSEHQENQNAHRQQPAAQPVQPSSQRRSQHRSDVYEDFERQAPPVQRQAQTQRRPAPPSAPAPRSRLEASPSNREQDSFKKAKLAVAELPLDTDDDGIPGEAGENYPTLHVIPKTTFSCAQQSHNGYYADLETSCQVVHLCQAGGVKNSFLCPNGTIWNQEKFSCQWWYKVNCSEAPKFYVKNDELYKVPEKMERKRN